MSAVLATVLEGVLLFGALLLLLPVGVLLLQVLAARRGGGGELRRGEAAPAAPRPRLAVLMPAHNEAGVIEPPLQALRAQLQPGDRLVVIADNCSDDTARLARAAGAEVVERQDAVRRGKGYALDFGLHQLAAEPPDVVLIVDADCLVQPGAVDLLARRCRELERPVQALYLMQAPQPAGLKARLAEFAWLFKNQVRPLGAARLGWPCQLMGSGMAFPWAALQQADLANGSVVEDMQLGIDLALGGHPVAFCPEACVTSEFPVAAAAVQTQRTRWEHGHLGMIQQQFPRLLRAGVSRRDGELTGLALDLAVPPLALLVLLLAATWLLSALGGWAGLGWAPLLLVSAELAGFATAILLAWAGWGRQVVSLGDLLSVPFYALGKIALYVRFWTRRQKEWVRTARDR